MRSSGANENDQWLRKGYYSIRLLIHRQAEFVSQMPIETPRCAQV